MKLTTKMSVGIVFETWSYVIGLEEKKLLRTFRLLVRSLAVRSTFIFIRIRFVVCSYAPPTIVPFPLNFPL
ncbi:hypothetical protein QVD17_31702 [Tagetes erecta]|uniref:Uncharacterized protein n=1 Tax=Tagetes erecta TaxID=13708 RepID=A0AAD8K3X2_TARER|nr:hypothetical protein QVD17_31702 [Tagetes erecta]